MVKRFAHNEDDVGSTPMKLIKIVNLVKLLIIPQNLVTLAVLEEIVEISAEAK